MLLALKCMVQKPSRSIELEQYCRPGSAKAYHVRDIDARNGPAWKLSTGGQLADLVSVLCTWDFGKRMEISVICRTEDHHSEKDKH
jgi:hypothetical protein